MASLVCFSYLAIKYLVGRVVGRLCLYANRDYVLVYFLLLGIYVSHYYSLNRYVVLATDYIGSRSCKYFCFKFIAVLLSFCSVKSYKKTNIVIMTKSVFY